MKRKVYLARAEDGEYALCPNTPIFDDGTIWLYQNKGAIIVSLCPKLTKKWFGLKKHLRKRTCVKGTFNVSFVPDKKGKGQ